MPWDKTPVDRRRDARIYQDPEYKRNRETRKRMAGGRCEQCQHPHARLQCDHIRNTGNGPPDHSIANLQMLCTGPGTCRCHEKKTAQEGGGYRNPSTADPEPSPRTRW